MIVPPYDVTDDVINDVIRAERGKCRTVYLPARRRPVVMGRRRYFVGFRLRFRFDIIRAFVYFAAASISTSVLSAVKVGGSGYCSD